MKAMKVLMCSEVMEIDPKLVLVEKRDRSFDNVMKNIEDLKYSIKTMGQLMPGACYKRVNGDVVLIFGHRRLSACESLGIKFRYQLVDRENMQDFNQWLLERLELEENICRVPLTWQEQSAAIANIDELYTKLYGEKGKGSTGAGHSIKDTAKVLGKSPATVSEAIKINLWADKIPQVAQAKTITEAKKIVAKLETALERKNKIDAIRSDNVEESELERFKRKSLCMDFEDFVKTNTERFDVVMFDPPWHVDFENERSIKNYDDANSEFDDMKKYIKMCYDLMNENSHLYLFFGIIHYHKIYNALRECGFECDGIPIVLRKIGYHYTRKWKRFPGRCWNPIAFARKGEKELQEKGFADYIGTRGLQQSRENLHPSAVHPSAYYNMLMRSAEPGDNILDPMSGSGSSAVAFELFSDVKFPINWTTVEKEQLFVNQQIDWLSKRNDFREATCLQLIE